MWVVADQTVKQVPTKTNVVSIGQSTVLSIPFNQAIEIIREGR